MFVQSMKMALKSICSNKMRSFLTMLGIIIGVMALVVLVSLVNGATGSITDSIHSLGKDMLSVNITDDNDRPIKFNELTDVIKGDFINEVAPVSSTSVTASSSYAEEESVNITGTTAAYKDIKGLELADGRFLLAPDIENNTNVIIINADLATDVMGRTNVVGEKIKLNGKAFLIIGVLESDSTDTASSIASNSSYEAYIPYTAMIRLSDSTSLNVSSFYCSVKGDDMDLAESALEDLLLERFEDEDSYKIYNQSIIEEAMESVTGTLSLLLGGIAGISLLVGGIGIMNIMLVSVTERTREIGIRKAIGAGRPAILFQFLIEALMVSLIGCFIGIGLSWCIIMIVNVVGDVSYSLSAGVAVLSILFSLGIGILFGLYPANKASKMKPIDALRFN